MFPSDQPERLMNGVKMPNIELIDENGNQVELASIKDKIVLVDFWASWCKPCLKAFPEMEKMYAKYKDAKLGMQKDLRFTAFRLMRAESPGKKHWSEKTKLEIPIY